jgi:hypothetical protein
MRSWTAVAVVIVAGTALGTTLLLIDRANHPEARPVAATPPVTPAPVIPDQSSSANASRVPASPAAATPLDAPGVAPAAATKGVNAAEGTALAAANPPQPVNSAAKGGKIQAPPKNASASQAENFQQPQVPAQPGVASAEPVVPLPIARSALSFVGDDPEAESVWLQAINDPNLSANARKDLIEDLNEDGFPDHKNLTLDDLPLIQSRIQLIEQLADDAMDDVNAAAFAEAYKDLVNMRRKVMGM